MEARSKMNKSLVSAINAIEHAPDDVDTGAIYEYCAENGLSEKTVDTLVKTPGDTDIGRLTSLQAAAASMKAAKKKAKKKPAKKAAKKKPAKKKAAKKKK